MGGRQLDVTEQKSINTRWYGVFALGVMPIYTLLFACQGNLVTTNLSQLGNRPGHHGRFILWGVICTGFLFTLFHRTFEMARYDGTAGHGLLLAACASFMGCVLVPFVPGRFPRAAKWHNRLAVLSALLTVAVSLLLSLHLRKANRGLCCQFLLQWAAYTGFCTYLLKATGISGLVEALFIIFTCVHTFNIMASLDKVALSSNEAEANVPVLD